MNGFITKTNDVYCERSLLCALQADGFLRVRGFELTDYLTCDIGLLRRRSKVFYDTSHINGLEKLVGETIDTLEHIRRMLDLQKEHTDSERALYSVKQLELYFSVVDSLYAFWQERKSRFTSTDYAELFGRAEAIALSEEYRRLKDGTRKLIDRISSVKSITVGFNLNAALAPYEAGILSVNDRPILPGKLTDRLLGIAPQSPYDSMCPLAVTEKQCNKNESEALNFAAYSALGKLFKRQVRSFEEEIRGYMSKNLRFLLELLPDLRFVHSIVGICSGMRRKGLRLCTPEYRPKEEKRFTAKGLYNPVLGMYLAEKDGSKAVKNDISFDEDGRIFILTGANNGGKSVFLCAVCLSQIMAQLGMPVPADSLTVSPAESILVHFPKYRSLHEKGRLAEECEDIRRMFSHTGRYSLCMFDEAFASTDAVGATALSREVLHALSYMGARGIYNTHLHGLTEMKDELNSALTDGASKAELLCAEVGEGQTRTYKILRGSASGESYARTVADLYGIRFDRLIKKT